MTETDKDQWWRDFLNKTKPDGPMFLSGEFVGHYGPIPDWLPHYYDLPRDGWVVEMRTPESSARRVAALRATLEEHGWYD